MADDRLYPLTPTDIRLKKDLGNDVSPNKYTAHEKLDLAKTAVDEILTDTADIQPRLVDVENDIANLQGTADSIQTTVEDTNTEIHDATTGLAAIKARIEDTISEVDSLEENLGTPSTGTVASHVEAIETKLGTPSTGTVASHVENVEALIGSPTNGTVSADMAQLDSKIAQIQNNTRTVIALNSELELPPTGQTRYFKVMLTNYDSVGDMEVPDSAPTLHVENSAGASKDANLGDWDGSTFSAGTTMLEDSPGVYYIFYRLPATATVNDQLIFNFTIIEGGLTRHIIRTTMVVEEISSTFTASDRVTLNQIDTNVQDVQNTLGTPAGADMSADIAAIKAQTQSIENKEDIIDSNVDNIKDTLLPEIRTKAAGTFNRETMSLEALAEAVANVLTSTTNKIWEAAKTSGTIAASGGTETVVITAAEGLASLAGILNTVAVLPTTSCTDYDIAVFADAANNKRVAKVTEWDSTKDGELDFVVNRTYVNSDAEIKLYVKITNNSNTAASFNVKLTGIRGFVA